MQSLSSLIFKRVSEEARFDDFSFPSSENPNRRRLGTSKVEKSDSFFVKNVLWKYEKESERYDNDALKLRKDLYNEKK